MANGNTCVIFHTVCIELRFMIMSRSSFCFVLPPHYLQWMDNECMSLQAWPDVVYSFQENITFCYECLLLYRPTECRAVIEPITLFNEVPN
jgi:hypothetical protein